MVIHLLLQEVAPQAVCTELGLCAGAKAEKHELVVPKVAAGGEFCVICETVMGYLKAAINDPNNEKTIEQALDEVCSIVPAADKGLCDMLVKQYTPAIINLLAQYDDPVKICSGLGLCNSKAKPASAAAPLKFQPMMHLAPAVPVRSQRPLLGAKKCTFGPSYWCKNEANARECNALDHCIKHYNLNIKP